MTDNNYGDGDANTGQHPRLNSECDLWQGRQL